jgi:hypothetical protein
VCYRIIIIIIIVIIVIVIIIIMFLGNSLSPQHLIRKHFTFLFVIVNKVEIKFLMVVSVCVFILISQTRL